MGLVFHGIGTMAYGQRDYWPDGSFVTTEWFVLAYVPIIPICSKRISYTRNSDYATYDRSGGYFVYETTAVDRKQAVYVYLWLASVIAPLLIWSTFQTPLAKILGDEDRAAGVFLGLTMIDFVFPYFLRLWVKGRKMKEWKRQSLGLHG